MLLAFNRQRLTMPPVQGQGSERADSKVLSDEEVEEQEASDSFPALGYPAGIGSIGSGQTHPTGFVPCVTQAASGYLLARNMHEVMLFCLSGHVLWHPSLQELYRAAWMLS